MLKENTLKMIPHQFNDPIAIAQILNRAAFWATLKCYKNFYQKGAVIMKQRLDTHKINVKGYYQKYNKILLIPCQSER